QKQIKIKKSKENNQNLLENSINDTNQTPNIPILILFFEEEFDDELLQINVKEVSIDMNNKLVIEKFFNIRTFEWNQEEIVEKNLDTYSQRHITSIDED
ncbi:25218_t:CDS:1, partial [Gigaspora margarita]